MKQNVSEFKCRQWNLFECFGIMIYCLESLMNNPLMSDHDLLNDRVSTIGTI